MCLFVCVLMSRLWCGSLMFLSRWSRTLCGPSVCTQMWFCPCPSTQTAAGSPPLVRTRRSEWLTHVLAPFYRCVSFSLMFFSVSHAYVFEAHIIIIPWCNFNPVISPTLNFDYELGHTRHIICVLAQKCTSPWLPLWHHTSKTNTFKTFTQRSASTRVLHSHCSVSSCDSDEHKTSVHDLCHFIGHGWLIFFHQVYFFMKENVHLFLNLTEV